MVAVRSIMPTSLQFKLLLLATPLLKLPSAPVKKPFTAAVPIGRYFTKPSVAVSGAASNPKFGVVLGVAHWFLAVTVALKFRPATKGAAVILLKEKLAGAVIKLALAAVMPVAAAVSVICPTSGYEIVIFAFEVLSNNTFVNVVGDAELVLIGTVIF